MACRSELFHNFLVLLGYGLCVLLDRCDMLVVVGMRVRVVRRGMVGGLSKSKVSSFMVHNLMVVRGGMVREMRVLSDMSFGGLMSWLVMSSHCFVLHNRH